jgi:hypothetical protein
LACAQREEQGQRAEWSGEASGDEQTRPMRGTKRPTRHGSPSGASAPAQPF